MGKEIENFVTYSLRYQLLLAQHVAGICNTKVYVFDNNDFFGNPEEIKVEVIDNVRTVSKNGKRAVLSLAVKESFGANEQLFLTFVDDNVVEKDNIGLYVVASNMSENNVEEDCKVQEPEQGIELKNISDEIEKIDSIL
jgi:hypothetical protein